MSAIAKPESTRVQALMRESQVRHLQMQFSEQLLLLGRTNEGITSPQLTVIRNFESRRS